MRVEDKYCCPNPDCAYIDYNDGECPECGKKLDKIKGDEYLASNDNFEDDKIQPLVSDFDDDPDMWYVDGADEQLGAM
ncbi:MAG: hypothetical protein WC107_02665 [Patescibacteria group bacterium]